MTEQVQSHTIGLARGHNGFFCPVSRFHLMGGIKPQGFWPAAAPLTEAVKVGLRGGTLVDVQRSIPREAYASEAELAAKSAASLSKTTEDVIKNQANANAGVDGDTGSGFEGSSLTEDEIDNAKLKDLKEFVKKNDLSLDELGLDSRSDLEQYRDSLKLHFGYKRV